MDAKIILKIRLQQKYANIFHQSLQYLLTKEQKESYENAKICFTCKEKFENKYLKDRKSRKVRNHCHYTGEYRGDGHSICNLKYNVLKNSCSFS